MDFVAIKLLKSKGLKARDLGKRYKGGMAIERSFPWKGSSNDLHTIHGLS